MPFAPRVLIKPSSNMAALKLLQSLRTVPSGANFLGNSAPPPGLEKFRTSYGVSNRAKRLWMA
jgi:hypothetical protein